MLKSNYFDEKKELINDYKNTKEYQEQLEKYRGISLEMSKLAVDYIEKPGEIIDKINHNVAYKKYGIGGLFLHRGVMCPSLIQDLVTGNCKRGRLVNKSAAKAVYEYWFDQNNQLIKVVSFGDIKVEEYIINSAGSTLGLTYDIFGKLSKITIQYFYMGKIVSYRIGLISSRTMKIIELNIEDYHYKENQLNTADMYMLTGSSLSHAKFFFEHSEDGYLHSYTSQELIGLEIMNKESCDEVYYIDQKRKV